MTIRHHVLSPLGKQFTQLVPEGSPGLVFDQTSSTVVTAELDNRDAVLARCQADPSYQRWVLACLQVRLSIRADQTFRHPADRRAQVARIIRSSLVTAPQQG